LVGCFLAGLVTHGGLQEWWIEAVLSRLNDTMLFYGSVVLTSFNDNAALTYLASLVPEFAQDFQLQSAVVGGAIVGGGLTVIANAPNPAGQSLLAKHFDHGTVKPLPLLLGALSPTLVLIGVFRGLF
jgi:Na+/H+ antiporter NhaD/arsenite permease-like protein